VSERTLTLDEARAFYDAFGARQDGQAFYEDAATHALAAHLELDRASALFELGCGTGRLAARWLERDLPADARYLGTDLSATMVGLARERLARFGARAEVREVDGSPVLAGRAAAFDRCVSTYVFDLLARPHITALVDEMARLVAPGGLVGVAGPAGGRAPPRRPVSGAWRGRPPRPPRLVGGCRPLDVLPFFAGPEWRIDHASALQTYGLTSQIAVARRL